MEHVDVIIVGAGLSGIGAAHHLNRACPDKRYLILEGRDAIGGTWDLFRYPGIRSDSDMFTLGYGFKPWRDRAAIAEGPSIKRYIEEAADEADIRGCIRLGHRVRGASWSSEEALWTLDVEHAGEVTQFRCNFLMMCSGYYRYEAGYTPDFPGRDRFQGQIVHPQLWPEDLDYAGKRIVVIGSGATAVTLIPNLAKAAAHVVMLQRSPTYMISRPGHDRIANLLRRLASDETAYRFTRWKNHNLQRVFYRMARRRPDKMRERLLRPLREKLGEAVVRQHFTPDYDPWDQRICLVPDDDFFDTLASGKAEVVTDRIESFTETGIQLQGGQHLDADLIITATGLDMQLLGGIDLSVDGEPVALADRVSYRGIMLSGVPNLSFTFGYTNASWTLRADLIAEYLCRLLNYMDARNAKVCVPRLRPDEQDMPRHPWFDDFTPGYITRAADRLPKQGDHEPWTHLQDYAAERKLLKHAPFDDGALRFS